MRGVVLAFISASILSTDNPPIPLPPIPGAAVGIKEQLPDYQEAFEYYKPTKGRFEKICKAYGQDPQFVAAIVYPEITRYSQVKDFLETKGLEMLYISGGCASADFSIGMYQMKPSFAETLELKIVETPALAAHFGDLFGYDSKEVQRQREERLRRLDTPAWQARYACAFVALMGQLYPSQLFDNEFDRLKFYASAYNLGIEASPQKIKDWQEVRAFPYGSKFRIPQCSYARAAEGAYRYLGQVH